MTLQENPRQQRPWNAWGFTETAGIRAIQARGGRQSANGGCVKTNGANGRAREAHQRVLLSGGQVQGGVVQAVHKVPQARHVHLILHGLRNGSTRRNTGLFRRHLISYIYLWYSVIYSTNSEGKPTAATGTRISTKRPAKACLMSLSLTSRKYWAHSCEKRWTAASLSIQVLDYFPTVGVESKQGQLQDSKTWHYGQN